MNRALSCTALAFGLLTVPITHALAEEISAVQTFARICYSQVPALQGIRNMAAQLAWTPLFDSALAPYAEGSDADIVEAWDVELGERSYRLGLVQGPMTEALKEDFPLFADARVTTCTLTLDDREPNESVADELQELVSKPPESKDVEYATHRVTSWTGGNDTVRVLVINEALQTGQGGEISVTLIAKP